MKDILFIINPVAGRGKAKRLIPLIEEMMKTSEKMYDIVTTKKPRQAIELASDGASKGYKTIVAVGGDGTINEVAKGIFFHGLSRLGIVPSGTGNDLAKTLNIPRDPKEAINIILKDKSRRIDVGCVNNIFFLNIASIGLDSEVLKNTENIKKKIKGKIAYVLGFFKTIFNYKNKNVEIELDDIKISEEVVLVAVGNGRYYGGGMKICPMALIEDGYFHTCVIKNISKMKLFVVFPLIFWGTHIKFKKHVEIYRAKKIKVKTKESIYLNIDGEIFKVDDEAVFTIDDKGIEVVCE